MLTPEGTIYFWSGIMKDHAELFLLKLSYREKELIEAASIFKDTFSNIETVIKKGEKDASLMIDYVIPILDDFINYKSYTMKKLLECDIQLNMTPTFINHMINEAMEFNRELLSFKDEYKINPVDEMILMHKIWLPDAAGHAAAIIEGLDPNETELINEANDYELRFRNLFITAVELGKMLNRTGLDNGTLSHLNSQAELLITEFIFFLHRVETARLKCQIMGNIDPFVLDHMIREEQYYLNNIIDYKEN